MTLERKTHAPSRLTALLMGLFFISCGGGTSGTGLNAYEGRVTNLDGSPIPGAVLTVESTGDSDVTNHNGEFLVHSQASSKEVSFLAETENFSSRFSVSNVFEEHSRFQVHVKIDPTDQRALKTDFNVRARMVGGCDLYFENRSVMRQANHVPPGTICTIKAEVLADGRPLDGATVALEYSSCEPQSTWTTLLLGTTSSDEDPGATKLSFAFESSARFCRYRVVAPYHFSDARPVLYPIKTFAEQAVEQ